MKARISAEAIWQLGAVAMLIADRGALRRCHGDTMHEGGGYVVSVNQDTAEAECPKEGGQQTAMGRGCLCISSFHRKIAEDGLHLELQMTAVRSQAEITT
jgi:hypothetical protein